MDAARLKSLIGRFDTVRALVVGDFFLDRYLVIDPVLAERSLETGLEAHQVVEVIAAPGAAGTITSNLRALGIRVTALGIIGDDGEGYELRRGLRATGVDDRALVIAHGRHTPTYVKPIVRAAAATPHERERLDIRTRVPTPDDIVDLLLARLRDLVDQADAVIIADQMPEPERGTITSRVRDELAQLATSHAGIWFLADSRERIGAFTNVIVKPNMHECVRAIYPDQIGAPDGALVKRASDLLRRRTDRPVFVTLGGEGMLVASAAGVAHVPAFSVRGPIDVVGAGDSAMAAITAGLCAGGTHEEAALLGNLAAAVTIQQLGTTGTATPQQIVAQWQACR